MFHVVFGAGQVGSGLARALAARGERVRVVRKSDKPLAGVEVVAADAMDRAAVLRAAEGADVVYHCMNPSAYTGAAWEAEFPVLGDNLIAAALANRARLVVLDNLYGYGDVAKRIEDSPMSATGRKGRVRVAWDARLRSTPDLRYVVGRAGDYFGPGAADNSLLSSSAIAGLAAGKRPWLLGDADAPHAYSYVPDVVAALAALGAADDVDRQVFLLPVLTVKPRELVARFSASLGTNTAPRVLPAWAVRALGPFVPLMGELRETLYQWTGPYLVDDTKFRTRFPGLATSLEAAVAETAPPVPSFTPARA